MKNQPIIENCVMKVVELDSLKEVEIQNLTLTDLLLSKYSIKINEYIYRVFINPPWIKHCQIPKVCMVNSPIYPIIDFENAKMEDFNISWLVGKSKTSTDWKKISTGNIYIPTEEYVNFHIKIEVTSFLNIKTQIFKVISSSPVQSLPQTDYQLAMFMEKSNLHLDENIFRLCSYNILSTIYAGTKQAKTILYRHCDPKFLQTDYRQCLILYELIQHNPDIIFLQEVDQDFYLKSLYPILKKQNFDGIYQHKSKLNLEGQAIFWNSDKFSFVENISIPCLTIKLNEDKSEVMSNIQNFLNENQSLWNRFQSLGQCMTGCILETKNLSKNKKLILSNNHLFYHPDFEIIRLFQLAIILFHIDQLKRQYDESICIIGGDFNASYEDESIKFVFDNAIEYCHMNKSIHLKHNIKNLNSAFKGILEFTNFTPDYVGLLDHVIFENCSLKVEKAYNLPSCTDILKNTYLPNEFHPSDHLPIFCDMTFL